MLPTVALIGRSNVGKSTLFNRLVGQNKALTHDQPGVTRDRIYAEVTKAERPFALVDTGGMFLEAADGFDADLFEQAREAIDSAQLILFVVDGKEGLTPVDSDLAVFLRQSGKSVYLVVNKVDGPEQEDQLLADFYSLGLPLFAVSAAHGYGQHDLLDEVCSLLPAEAEEKDEEYLPGLRISLLGRPNVGKSSIINALCGEKRLIVSPQPGTTRDSVDVEVVSGERHYVFLDTAGVRRKSHIQDSLERFSVLRSLKSSKRAQVTILVLDALEGITGQDKRLLALLGREKTPFIVAVNKIDLIPKEQRNEFKCYIQDSLRFCPYVPIVYTSAVNKNGLGGILPLAEKLWAECNKRISTGELNRIMQKMTSNQQPPMVKQRRAKFYYMTQPQYAPPTFVFFVNDPSLIKSTYSRYLEKQIRKYAGLRMTPIRLLFRSSHGK